MSNTKILKIKPQLAALRNEREERTLSGFQCPWCKGKGYLVTGVGYHGSEKGVEYKEDCHRCDASGELNAFIVIEWKPKV